MQSYKFKLIIPALGITALMFYLARFVDCFGGGCSGGSQEGLVFKFLGISVTVVALIIGQLIDVAKKRGSKKSQPNSEKNSTSFFANPSLPYVRVLWFFGTFILVRLLFETIFFGGIFTIASMSVVIFIGLYKTFS